MLTRITSILLTAAVLATAQGTASNTQKLFPTHAARVEAAADKLKALPADAPTRFTAVRELRRELLNNLAAVLAEVTAPVPDLRASAALAEAERLDKQVGATPAAPGTTSLVSKGSVPSLLGFAVENGGATRDVTGTTATFRMKPAALLKGLVRQSYLLSAPTPIDPLTEQMLADSWLYKALEKASFSVSFDVARGAEPGTFTGRKDQLAQYSFRYEIVNRRDPRDKRHLNTWLTLRDTLGRDAANSGTVLFGDLQKHPGYEAWVTETLVLLEAAEKDAVSDIYRQSLLRLSDQILRNAPALQARMEAANRAFQRLVAARLVAQDYIQNSPAITLEYALTRQKPENIEAPEGAALASGTRRLPDLQNVRLIAAGRIVPGWAGEFTFNTSATFFRNLPAEAQARQFRDWQAALEMDMPLTEIQGIGKPALALSGRFVRLREQPLGEKITVNGVEFDTRGNIWVGQAKLTVRVGDSGVQVPLSVTVSNRTELLTRERDVRGNIGLTFDLDKLFARGLR